MKETVFTLCALVILATPLYAQETAPKPAASSGPLFDTQFSKEPTYIKADSLTLKSEERYFVYTGHVEVRQGDMTLTSDIMEGTYTENNKIAALTAKKNVYIVKGENIRATGEKAVYEGKTETVKLTENPELQQEESVLTADLITIFLKENRSTAEGNVRVKLVKKEEKKK